MWDGRYGEDGELEDLDDDAQTPVQEPKIGTTLTDDAGAKDIKSGKTKLVDVVKYDGLKAGTEYTLLGELMVKDKNDPLVENGTPVRAVATFTAESSSGEATVEFEVDTTGLEGKELVAFETVYEFNDGEKPKTPEELDAIGEKTPVAEHKDIKDVAQTVKVGKPKIGTTLADDAGHKDIKSGKTTFVDTVAYKGLEPGKEYTLLGELMVKEKNDPLVENGKPVRAVAQFTPDKSSGKTKVNFEVDTKGLEGKELVAFETVYELKDNKKVSTPSELKKSKKKVVAKHKDINDKGQTVRVMSPSGGGTPDRTSAKTGDYIVLAALVLMAISMAAYGITRRKKHE